MENVRENSEEKKHDAANDDVETGSFNQSLRKGDLLGQESVDPVLDMKMHLINNVRLFFWFRSYSHLRRTFPAQLGFAASASSSCASGLNPS